MSTSSRLSGISLLFALVAMTAQAGQVRADEDSYFRHLKDGARQARSGKLAPALESFRAAVQADPFQMDAYFNAGNVARRLDRCPDVVRYFQGFLALSPGTSDDAIARDGIAKCLRKPGMGRLTVTTGLEGHWVLLDGGVIGRTPIADVPVPVGKLQVTATCRCPDFEDATRLIKMETSGAASIEMPLKARVTWGSIHVVTEPVEGVSVHVDDVEVGVTPMEPLRVEAGRRFIRLEKPGYHRWVRNVVIERDRIETVRASLEQVDDGRGSSIANPGER